MLYQLSYASLRHIGEKRVLKSKRQTHTVQRALFRTLNPFYPIAALGNIAVTSTPRFAAGSLMVRTHLGIIAHLWTQHSPKSGPPESPGRPATRCS